MIDKFAQDSTTTGLSFSPTLVSGLWEWALEGLESNTEEARNNLIDAFASDYFRGRGNLVPTLKALHYKAVKKDGIVSLEIDDAEPTADDKGEIIDLPHTYAGNTYQKAYVPHSVARVYFDGKTFREVYISQLDKTPNDASDFYWFNIMKQAKNRFGLFPKMDWGIQLVTRPWAEDAKDTTKYHKVEMDYLDVIDMGGDPYDPKLTVTFRKEPVTGKECYDSETEILTDKGWKYFKDLHIDDLVASIDDDDNVMFVKPTKYIESDYSGDMIKFENRAIDLLVTPNHKMYVDYKEFSDGIGVYNGKYCLVKAEDMLNDYVQFKMDGNWFADDVNIFVLEAYQREIGNYGSVEIYSQKTFDMDVWLEFIGYYLTEGWVREDRGIAGISQTDVINRERIRNCLLKLDIPFREYKKDFQIWDWQLVEYLKQFGKCECKFVPRDLLFTSKRQLRILYDALMLGDGNKNGKRFTTTSKQLADDFQELCLRVGYVGYVTKSSANVGDAIVIDGKITGYSRLPIYRVHIRRKWVSTNNKRGKDDVINSVLHYDGKIYCVDVPVSSHVLYVRRNGKPVWCGNSIQTHPVKVDFSSKYRGTMGMNPTVALEATIDYDGDTIVAFVPAIKDAIVELDAETKAELKKMKMAKYDHNFDELYAKARKFKTADNEAELGVMCAAYNQQIAETENELIERLGGLRKRSMILQGKQAPPVVVIGEGTKYEETHTMDIALINQVTDVEKILKMREPRWKVKTIEKRPIEDLTKDEWELVRDSYLRKELTKLVNIVIKDKGVKKLYDLLREPSDYMKREFVTKSGYEGDPIGLKIDTESRLLDRILYNELREADIFEDLDNR